MSNGVTILSTKDKNGGNCVLWARTKIPSLPFGLWTISDKLNIMNDKEAKKGSVAVINVGWPYGHVAVVKYVVDEKICINEANFMSGKITERTGTEKELKIVGYFNPNLK